MSKASVKSLYLHFLDEFLSTDDQFSQMLETNALALLTELEAGKARITRSELNVREIASKLDVLRLTYTSDDPIGAMIEAWNIQANILNEIWIEGDCDMERLGPSLIALEWSSSLEIQENQSRVMVKTIALSSSEFPMLWYEKLNNCSSSLNQWGVADLAEAYLDAQMELKKLEQDWKRLQKREGLTLIELYKFWSAPSHKKLSQAVTKAEQECEDLCEKARLDRERLEQERLDQERLRIEYEAEERKRYEMAERERQQQERFERERVELERFERERLELERLEKVRQVKERLERERKQLERFEKERLRLEREESERKVFEKQAQELKRRERLEKERIELERLKRERLEEARKETERKLQDRLEREALEREKKESFARAQQEKLQEEKERKQQEELAAQQAQEIRKKRKRFTAIAICLLLVALGYYISVSEEDSYYSVGSTSQPFMSDKSFSTNNGLEYRTRHILVETENEAKSLIIQIKNGAKFEDLAKKFSKDAGSNLGGGDLGWEPASSYVPEFSNAMVKLNKGQISELPVKTQFGFHIIRMDDARVLQPAISASLPPQSAWLQNGLYGHDNPAAALKQVRITEIQSGRYSVTISNQFGFACSIEFDSNGNPFRLRACSSATEPSWSASPQVIDLRCEKSPAELVCRGKYELSSGAYSSPSEMVIALRL
jgi:parvulin-like peptidyl-prolyl isomerase